MNNIDLSYTAGFFDGEGCIRINKRFRKQYNAEYSIFVSIGQKEGSTLDWIKNNFNIGNVYLVKKDKSFVWALSNNNAYLFLKQIAPFLKYKKPQAELAIKFYEECIIANRHRNKTKGISEKELLEREEYLLEMKRLKRVFINSVYCK